MRARSLIAATRLSPVVTDQANVAKLCITPLGAPVVPEVYMMVASSSPSRSGSPASGAVRATMSSHCGELVCGASGIAMHGSDAGTPGFMPSQPSSLPTNSSFDSLCARIWRIVSAASVGYSGTDTPPAIHTAQSAINHQAVFFDSSATRSPGAMP